jgi:hypothetical protein
MAAVEVIVDELNPDNMPDRLSGAFTILSSKTKEAAVRASFLIHSNRIDDGLSHTIWFHGNRTGYRFTMPPGTAFGFSAEKMCFQPDQAHEPISNHALADVP